MVRSRPGVCGYMGRYGVKIVMNMRVWKVKVIRR